MSKENVMRALEMIEKERARADLARKVVDRVIRTCEFTEYGLNGHDWWDPLNKLDAKNNRQALHMWVVEQLDTMGVTDLANNREIVDHLGLKLRDLLDM